MVKVLFGYFFNCFKASGFRMNSGGAPGFGGIFQRAFFHCRPKGFGGGGTTAKVGAGADAWHQPMALVLMCLDYSTNVSSVYELSKGNLGAGIAGQGGQPRLGSLLG